MDWSSKEKSVIDFIVKTANESIDPEKVLLFGSRARRDHRENSDYDFAFFQMKKAHLWSRFVLTVEEEAPTLCQVDLINFDEIDGRFKSIIQKEGILIRGQ